MFTEYTTELMIKEKFSTNNTMITTKRVYEQYVGFAIFFVFFFLCNQLRSASPNHSNTTMISVILQLIRDVIVSIT